LRAMQESGSPDAMVHQWGEMKEYKFIDNLNFVKEFASVVFIALRHMYGSAAESHQSHVGTMSTEELLHAIDIITDQVSNASQTTNDYNAQNLQDWLQHYWWVIPFTVGSIAVRMIYYHYSMHSHHYGMYGSGGYHHQSSDLMF